MLHRGRKWLIVLIPVISGIILAILVLSDSCKKDEDITLPLVGTVSISDVGETTFKGITSIGYDGGAHVMERGLCWSTNPNPTILDDRTSDGEGAGTFHSDIMDLTPSTLYHVRSYATNSEGTGYGDFVNVHTWTGTVNDIDNNSYHTIVIGSQEWMGENLRVKQLNNGIKMLPLDPVDTLHNTVPGYWYYDTPEGGTYSYDKDVYGPIYNGYAVLTDKLCPQGWHIPSSDDWQTLVDYLGGYKVAGGKMKEAGTTHWQSPNNRATNESGFKAIPGGCYNHSLGFGGCGGGEGSHFSGLGDKGLWWSSTQNIKDFRSDLVLYVAVLLYDSTGVYPGNGFQKDGRSVRCIKNQ